MPWLIQTAGGIDAIHQTATLQPYFFNSLDWAVAESKGVKLHWEKKGGKVLVQITVPNDMEVSYRGTLLKAGTHLFEELPAASIKTL